MSTVTNIKNDMHIASSGDIFSLKIEADSMVAANSGLLSYFNDHVYREYNKNVAYYNTGAMITPYDAGLRPISYSGWGPYFKDGVSVGNLPSTTNWQEISGMTNSTRSDNSAYLWIVSDSPANMLAAIKASDASSQGVWTLQSPPAYSDWEDITSCSVSGQPYIYIADFGDNGNARSSFNIFRANEPLITGTSGVISSSDYITITCQFPAGNMPTHKDAECLLADPDTGDLYVITKRESIPGVYKLPHAATYGTGVQSLTYMGKMYDIPDITTVPLGATTCNVVGGTISPNGKEIMIKNYDSIYYFSRPDKSVSIYNTLTGTPVQVSYVGGGSVTPKKSHPNAEPQGESVCFDYSGVNYYTASEYISTEGSSATTYPLFRYDRIVKSPNTIIFQDGLYPSGGYAGTLDTYIWDTSPTGDFGTATSMVVDTAVGVETDQRKSLLYFDISAIPRNSTVVSARLDLYLNTEGQGFKFHRMLTGWNESSNYNYFNGGIDNDGIKAAVAEDCRNGINLDTITGLIRNNMSIPTIQTWVNYPSLNYGWMIEQISSSTGDGVQFDTRQSTVTGRRPKLTISYI